MKSLKRVLALLICVGILCACFPQVLATGGEPPATLPSWNNGNLLEHIADGDASYYGAGTPFGYAFYYEGTDPDDSRSAGFHDMILSDNGGTNTWTNGRYFCGLNAGETQNCNRVNSIHLAASNAPSYHYSLGVVFTAPQAGTVEFTYQYAGLDSASEQHTFYVMRETATGYGDALYSYKPVKVVRSNGTGGEYDTAVMQITVAAGEKIYFITDNTGNGSMSAHWISTAKYLAPEVTYTLATDKETYTVGTDIVATATLSSGSFGTEDYIAIVAEGQTDPTAKKAATASVTFTGGVAAAGKYTVVLVVGGKTVASRDIQVNAAPASEQTEWHNGNLLEHIAGGDASYYGAGTPFGYAFYYEGTDPDDSRSAGFHDMILSDNGGTNTWTNGRYFCGLNAGETQNCNRVNSIHLAASNAPSYHYSLGVVFTAPQAGTVEFTYQYAGLDSASEQHTFYVMRETATGYGDALYSYKPVKVVRSNGTGGEYDTAVMQITVAAGEKIYFITDNTGDGSMSAHWISSAEYLTTAEISYGVSTDKTSYTVGDEITVSATVPGAIFAAEDYIAIVAEGQTDPTAKKAAAVSVSFTDIPVGNYQVLLVVGGKTVASVKIRVQKEMTAADTTWDNGAITAHVGAAGEKNYIQAPFGYAFFYEGTDPEDTRSAGFHNMVLSSNGGAYPWSDGRYFCGLNAGETQNCNRVNAIHLAAANAPSYHYSPGFVFTAPFTGTVEFTYQYAGLDSLNDTHTFYVMRDSATGYGDAVKSYKQTETLANTGIGSYGEDTFTLEVTAGEKIYFVTDNTANAGMGVHWIKSAKYLIGGATYTLSTGKELYDLGEKITVSATVSTGTFGTDDYIAIIADGKQTPQIKLSAAESVIFEPTAKELPAGKYQVVLVLNGQDAYLSDKANYVACCEILVRDAIDPNNAAWSNGTLLTRLGTSGENAYYRSGSPFAYGFFYEGTDPEDSRARGFYNMILSNNGGKNAWTNGRYFCGLNAWETDPLNRVNAIHLAASVAPNYHYSPGLVFTAPYTGTVKLTYQFGGLDTIDANHTFYVMRDSADGYDDALYSFKATRKVYSNGTGREYNEQVLTIDVVKGEKIYFVVDNTASAGMSAHWISAVQYLDASGKPISQLPAPDTGDDSALGFWLTALVLSVSGLGVMCIVQVKRRRKNCYIER